MPADSQVSNSDKGQSLTTASTTGGAAEASARLLQRASSSRPVDRTLSKGWRTAIAAFNGRSPSSAPLLRGSQAVIKVPVWQADPPPLLLPSPPLPLLPPLLLPPLLLLLRPPPLLSLSSFPPLRRAGARVGGFLWSHCFHSTLGLRWGSSVFPALRVCGAGGAGLQLWAV